MPAIIELPKNNFTIDSCQKEVVYTSRNGREITQEMIASNGVKVAQVAERYQHNIYRAAVRIVRDDERAKDVAQNTYMKMLLHGKTILPDSLIEEEVNKNVIKTTVSEARDEIRYSTAQKRDSRKTHSLNMLGGVGDTTDDTSREGISMVADDFSVEEEVISQIEAEYLWGKVVEAAKARSDSDISLRLFRMSVIEGIPQSEIAERTKTPLGTVKSKISRLLSTTRDLLAQDEQSEGDELDDNESGVLL